MNNSKNRRRGGRWLRLCSILLVTTLSAPTRSQLLPQALDTSTGTSSGSLKSSFANQQQPQKVGLAPHDRPACQLPPIATQRRLSNSSPLPLVEINDNNSSSSSLISVPNVVSLQTTSSSQSPANRLSPSRKFDSSERLRQLRQLLTSNNYDAYLVTPIDEHGSEYVSDYDRRLRFVSGFTGSNGYALILLDRAVLFTDGRYAIQADKDLDCNWWLVVSNEPLVDIHLWLKANAAKGIKIATDARLMSLQSFDYLDEQIKQLDSEFALISQDLIDIVWNNDNESPARLPPQDLLSIHPVQFSGNISWQEKLVRLAESMAKLQARHYIVSQLDDIAWLLNLRGNDIPMAPLFKAYLLISRSSNNQDSLVSQQQASSSSSIRPPSMATSSVDQLLATTSMSGSKSQASESLQSPQVVQVQPNQIIKMTLYINLKKVDQQIRDHLRVDNLTLFQSSDLYNQGLVSSKIQVELKDYDVFIMDLREKLAPSAGNRQLQGRLLLNAGANVAIHVLAKTYEDRLILMESLINKLKSVKSDSEVQGMRLAHWRDSLAISMLLSQLDHDIGTKQQTQKWSETSAASELEFYRSLMDHNKGQSFDTISAYGSNAAIVHYKPSEEDNHLIGNQSTYLLDSGGQYLDGTTDITRTVHFGQATEFQRETYTRVLMGAIDMMSIIFDYSQRTPYRLDDMIARRHLMELGLDYAHGTGHGIGQYSMVHETPYLVEHYTSVASQRQMNANSKQKPSPLIHSDPVPLQANMFTSIEPGYYKANDFGIRLENIVVIQRVQPRLSALLASNTKQAEPSRQFLRLEPLSLVPFEPKLIKRELLSNKQKAWLNSYNLMVRLRMTQQINYYLSKLRNSQPTQPAVVQIQGTRSGSRLYQQILTSSSNETSTRTNSSSQYQLGLLNYLRLDGVLLQEKLEQTHRWIMSKTELIPLDVPQSLVASNSGGEQESETRKVSATAATSSSSRESHDLDSRRLLLTYMSSLPFNDEEAAEAVAALDSINRSQLSGRNEQNGTTGSPSKANKCSGIECDLWLLDSLSSNAYMGNSKPIQRQRISASLAQFAEPQSSTGSSSSDSNSIMDLFQLSGSGPQAFNMWSLGALVVLVSIQLVAMVYMCKTGFGASSLCGYVNSRRQSAPINNNRPATVSSSVAL